MRLWRISNHLTLNGEGARFASGRWHTAGRRIVYLAESPAGALLEILVHIELQDDELPTFNLLAVDVENGLVPEDLAHGAGEDWKNDVKATRAAGDQWLAQRRSLLARVPSSIMPQTYNVLLNPSHPDALQAQITTAERGAVDARLLRMTSFPRENHRRRLGFPPEPDSGEEVS